MTTQALEQIRVLDLSRILAGPWCTQLLADLGAEVIKIERPGAGDDTRGWGPPFLRDHEGNETTDASYYLAANRGKKSAAVDISTPQGQKILLQLAESCDVLVENYKVDGLKKYGLDYQSLSDINPKLVYCSITGFGQTGPYAHRAGYDFMIQAMGGLMSVTGEADDRPGAGPQKVGVAMADILTGLYAANAIQAALLHREHSGRGQHIDMALFDVQVAALANQALYYLVSGKTPGRAGNAHPNIVPYQVFATRDGHIILAVGNDGQFARFCEVANCPEMSTDPNFSTNARRVVNRTSLIPMLEKIMRERTSDEWLRVLETAGIPCGPINDIDQVFDDPQAKHRGLRWQTSHTVTDNLSMVKCPIEMSQTAVQQQSAPPLLGQHTDEVLGDLGLDGAVVKQMRSDGVIG